MLETTTVFRIFRPGTDSLTLLALFLLGDILQKSLRLRRFISDRDEIWRIVLQVNTHRLPSHMSNTILYFQDTVRRCTSIPRSFEAAVFTGQKPFLLPKHPKKDVITTVHCYAHLVPG